MGLETTTYISGLVASNPTSSDFKTQGDDHIRLVKSALLNTFPNVTGAMTRTHTELNNALSSSQWSFNSDRLVNNGNTQPAFNAYRSSTQSSGNRVIFNTVTFNQGSCYNNSTGLFTAPVGGMYLFATNVIFQESPGGSGSHATQFWINSTTLVAEFTKKYSPYEYWGACLTTVLKMSTNDTIEVYVNNMANVNVVASGQGCQFSGHLIA